MTWSVDVLGRPSLSPHKEDARIAQDAAFTFKILEDLEGFQKGPALLAFVYEGENPRLSITRLAREQKSANIANKSKAHPELQKELQISPKLQKRHNTPTHV